MVWVEALVAIQGWERCWNWGILLDMEEETERGIKVNMKVSDWNSWVVAGT